MPLALPTKPFQHLGPTIVKTVEPCYNTGLITAARVRELFAGYKYLHTVVKYVHRDLEDKHVGLAEDGCLCVFDLSTCVPLAGGGAASVGYAGESRSREAVMWLYEHQPTGCQQPPASMQ